MAMAGYVWRKSQIKRFNRQWAKTLEKANEGKEHKARYFHMKDVGGVPPMGEFRSFTEAEVDGLARKLIAQAKKRTLIGFGVTFSQADYNAMIAGRAGMQSAYAFGCWAIMGMVRRWIERENISQKIHYIFEECSDQNDAKAFLAEKVFVSERQSALYNRYGESWLPKLAAPPLQTADMLAWHAARYQRDKFTSREPRADFIELARADLDLHRHYERHNLEDIQKVIDASGIPDDPSPYVPPSPKKRNGRSS